jgi:L-seryl-tRNA(Ser) seleniumtransferase
VRADKLTLAAMEATLWAHARGAQDQIPAWSMLHTDEASITARAHALCDGLTGVEVIEGRSVTGGGSLPGRTVPTALLAVRSDKPQLLAKKLRDARTPVIARVERGMLVLDLRTVTQADDDAVRAALESLNF